jgi:hypothetical protein
MDYLLWGMRAVAATLALALGLGGCNKPDPDWAKPCAEQRAPSVQVGTGDTEFVPIGTMGIPIEVDATGTYVWLGVSVQGFGPTVTVSGSIADASSMTQVAALTSTTVSLAYDHGIDRDLYSGLQLAVVPSLAGPYSVESLVGKNVTLTADVVGCKRTGHGHVATQISGFDVATCQGCLFEACSAELGACDADCTALQACLDTYCVELSALASPEEAECQLYCQSLHPSSKAKHVALVNCVQASMCQPPCNGYSIDYDECAAALIAPTTGGCTAEYAPCSGTTGDCASFSSCVSTCSTWAACQHCAAAHPTGAMQYEAYQSCVESTCLVLGWLPHM